MLYDLIVIGSGPAGKAASIRAAQNGLKTLVIDKKYVGGMCLNWGCVPMTILLETAKMLHKVKNAPAFGICGIEPENVCFDWQAALARKDAIVDKLGREILTLWNRYGVDYVRGEARISSPSSVIVGDQLYDTKNILIATGSYPPKTDKFPNAIDLEYMKNIRQLPESVLVYGAGSHALEVAQFFGLIGKKTTFLLEDHPAPLVLDGYLYRVVGEILAKSNVQIVSEKDAKIENGRVFYQDKEIEYDIVINSRRRTAILPKMDIQLELDNGFIKTSSSHKTSVEGVYAAGDVAGKSSWAHTASAYALEAVNTIMGIPQPEEEKIFPINVYSYPEISQLGMTVEQAKEQGIDYKVRKFSLTSNARALAQGAVDGFIRLVYEPTFNDVLGVQIVAENASELINEAAMLMELGGSINDLTKVIHSHPAISEVFNELGELD